MNVYALRYSYNQYDQLDSYVVALFKDMPNFHELKKFYDNCSNRPTSQGKTYEACIGMLARGEQVQEFTNGGDLWYIEPMEVIDGLSNSHSTS